jgi:hypothetical protein
VIQAEIWGEGGLTRRTESPTKGRRETRQKKNKEEERKRYLDFMICMKVDDTPFYVERMAKTSKICLAKLSRYMRLA